MIVAYLNENACNPVLREQSKVTIGYFSGSVLGNDCSKKIGICQLYILYYI